MRAQNLTLFLIILTAATGCASMDQPLKSAAHVDLPKYMGDWHVIANIPYFAEKGCVDSIESYALRPDGDIDNRFTCRKNSFAAPMKQRAFARATIKDKTSNAVWSVHMFKVLPVRYLILELDPDYQWVALGHPTRRYGWIMSRSASLPEETYHEILNRLQAQGYDPSKFQKVPQSGTTH
jgi:apolipoprotein D and lipocalin family protein